MLADHCNHYLINVWWEIYRLPKDLAKMSESLRMRQSSSKNPVGTDNNLYKTTNSYHNLRYALTPHIHTWWNTLQYPLTNLWNTNWGQKYWKAKFASFCQLFWMYNVQKYWNVYVQIMFCQKRKIYSFIFPDDKNPKWATIYLYMPKVLTQPLVYWVSTNIKPCTLEK